MTPSAPWLGLVFSPRGRLNRKRFWLITAASTAIEIVVDLLASIVTPVGDTRAIDVIAFLINMFDFILYLVLFYVSIAITIKRLHDRDRPGTFYLIIFVPIVGAIWLFIEAGCLRGTVGRNRFGPDPLALHDDIIKVFDAPPPLGRS